MGEKWWLKIGKKEDIAFLKNNNLQGFSKKCSSGWPCGNSLEKVKEGDLMILYIKNIKEFYAARIKRIEITNTDNKGSEWVNFLHLEHYLISGYYLGKIKLWKELEKELEFWKEKKKIGLALNCSMREISKDDFDKMVNYFRSKPRVLFKKVEDENLNVN